jgi:importin subunit alpha-1
LCRGTPTLSLPITLQLLPKLKELITSGEDEVQEDALAALSHLSHGEEDQERRLSAFVEAGALPRVVQLLASPSLEVISSALSIVGNIAMGGDLLTQAVLNEGALHSVLALMSHFRRTVRSEACWVVSQVCAGTPGQIQMVFECNLFPALIHQLQQGESDVQREACRALSNTTKGGNARQIYELVRLGVVPPLKHALRRFEVVGHRRVQGTQAVALEGLENILKSQVPAGMPEGGDPKHYFAVMEQADVPSEVRRLGDEMETLRESCERFLQTFFPSR